MTQSKPYQWLAWIGTVSLLAAAAAAAVNAYPYYVWGFIFSNLVWTAVGVLWKERSLVAMNAGLTVIYLIGLMI